jgi:hypothetical protein
MRKQTSDRRAGPGSTLPAVAMILIAAFTLACDPASSEDPGAKPDSGSVSASTSDVQAPDVMVPAGVEVAVRLAQSVSSGSSRPGDAVYASVVEPVRVGEQVVIDAGSTLTGSVVAAAPAKRMGGQASLAVEFHTLRLGSGEQVAMQASIQRAARSQTRKDAATIGGAAAGGALLGRIFGHQSGRDAHGTTVGALLGGAAGTAIAASNRGDEVTLPEGSVIRVRLDAPVRLTVVG